MAGGRLEQPCLCSEHDSSSGNLQKVGIIVSVNFNSIHKNVLTFADKSLPDKAKHHASARVTLGGCVKCSNNKLVYTLSGCR